jgi:hypothetical protein
MNTIISITFLYIQISSPDKTQDDINMYNVDTLKWSGTPSDDYHTQKTPSPRGHVLRHHPIHTMQLESIPSLKLLPIMAPWYRNALTYTQRPIQTIIQILALLIRRNRDNRYKHNSTPGFTPRSGAMTAPSPTSSCPRWSGGLPAKLLLPPRSSG